MSFIEFLVHSMKISEGHRMMAQAIETFGRFTRREVTAYLTELEEFHHESVKEFKVSKIYMHNLLIFL